jgi:Sap, sulfolipid-1-addressing protein
LWWRDVSTQGTTHGEFPGPIQQVLKIESTLVAWILSGAAAGPTAYYLAAIAAIVGKGAGVAPSVAALIVFNLIAFILAESSSSVSSGHRRRPRKPVDRVRSMDSDVESRSSSRP